MHGVRLGLLIWFSSVSTVPVVTAQVPKSDQLDRRDRREPAIVPHTGGRTGTCDVLLMAPDGAAVLAAGDDKVVSVIPFREGRLLGQDLSVLRWPMWREQRGSIFAMAVSRPGDLVAVGGYGVRNSTVAVIERSTGRIRHLVNLEKDRENFFAVMALDFSADGQRLAIGTGSGAVWVWDFAREPTLVGRHRSFAGTPYNRVRAVRCIDSDQIESVAEDGQWVRWVPAPKGWTAESVRDVGNHFALRMATFSARGNLAVGELGPTVRVVSPDGKVRHRIDLAPGEFPRAISFDPTGDRLAVSVGHLKRGERFVVEGDDRIEILDISSASPSRIARLPHKGPAEALVLHERHLIVAGGDNHEITHWNLSNPEKPQSSFRGVGSGIWAVELTKEGRYLLFSDERDPNASEPNRRGKDSRRIFDLRRRRYETMLPKDTSVVRSIDELRGWSVRADEKSPWQWHVMSGDGRSFALPWNRDTDGRPTCYTFVPTPASHPVRLAVGHYWGFSLFEVTSEGVRRVKLYTGHQGEVTALCPSADGTWLVSASRDQTVSGWSLADWPSGNGIGATFRARGDRVQVTQVDVGSPAWEMGLIAGDEITFLAVGAREFFGPGLTASADEAKETLERAAPGEEIFVHVNRAGRPQPFRTLSTMRQRPLWRFLPGPNREWVLWSWHGGFYDTSTNGDTLAGWVLNDPTLSQEPRFFRLEQFREAFHREDVIDELVETHDIAAALKVGLGANPVPIPLGLNEPPATRIEVKSSAEARPVTIRCVATARGEQMDFLPQRVELWINDYRFRVWEPRGQSFDETLTIEADELRSGSNRLTLQAFNRLGGRSEAVATVAGPSARTSGRLLGLGIGINDYGLQPSIGGKRKFGNLQGAVRDVQLHAEVWQSQKGRLYHDSEFRLRPDAQAIRRDILMELDHFARTARPDDLLIVVLCGHGDFRQDQGDRPKKSISRFYFCCPDYDPQRPRETGIEHTELYEKLATIRCRKVVFLDACHAGEATFNPVRSLTPGGVGPIIYAACDRSELAYEHPQKKNGLFTLAVVQSLSDGFAQTDRNSDGQVDSRELMDAIRRNLPALLREIGRADDLQNPQCFPRQPENVPLYRR